MIWPVRAWAGTINYIDGTRPEGSCKPSLERTFSKRYLSVESNLASLNQDTAVMQQKAFTWVDFISPCGHIPFIYIIRCIPSNGCTVFAYM